jgi:hypothetical protein
LNRLWTYGGYYNGSESAHRRHLYFFCQVSSLTSGDSTLLQKYGPGSRDQARLRALEHILAVRETSRYSNQPALLNDHCYRKYLLHRAVSTDSPLTEWIVFTCLGGPPIRVKYSGCHPHLDVGAGVYRNDLCVYVVAQNKWFWLHGLNNINDGAGSSYGVFRLQVSNASTSQESSLHVGSLKFPGSPERIEPCFRRGALPLFIRRPRIHSFMYILAASLWLM